MALVYVVTAASKDEPVARREHDRFLHFYRQDRFGTHQLTEDVDLAHLILFIENGMIIGPLLTRSYLHPLARAHRNKCFTINPRFKGLPLMPGLYASLDKRDYNEARTRSGHYFEVVTNKKITYSPGVESASYLFSFLGQAWTHSVRNSVLDLHHPRAKVEDTAQLNASLKKSDRYFERYLEICRDSKFILCPRGAGPSSLRLFECLKLGRIPVIISDDWVPPPGPDWETFSVRIAESNVASIPECLEEREADAPLMAHKAHKAWEEWFAAGVTFHRSVECCLDIMNSRPWPETVLRLGLIREVLRPRHARSLARTILPSSLMRLIRTTVRA